MKGYINIILFAFGKILTSTLRHEKRKAGAACKIVDVLLMQFTLNIFLHFVYRWNTKLYVSQSSYYVGEPLPFPLKRFVLPSLPHAKIQNRKTARALCFGFKFVNTEITIEYAKQRQWPALKFMRIRLQFCIKHVKIDVIITWGKKRSPAHLYFASRFSEQLQKMKYSIIRRYYKLDSLFPAELERTRKNNNAGDGVCFSKKTIIRDNKWKK